MEMRAPARQVYVQIYAQIKRTKRLSKAYVYVFDRRRKIEKKLERMKSKWMRQTNMKKMRKASTRKSMLIWLNKSAS